MPKKEQKLTSIANLFEKYKKTLKAPQGTVIETFIEVVDDVIGIKIPKEQIRYTVAQKIISLRASGPLKTEIKLHQEEILTHLRGRLGTQSAPREIL